MSTRFICNKLYRITLRSSLYFPHITREYNNSIPIFVPKCYYSKIQNDFAYNYDTNKIRTDFSDRNRNSKKDNDFFMKNDPDRFGTSTSCTPETEFDDPGDIEEEEYIKNIPHESQKLTLKEYSKLIKDHLDHYRLKEAIDVLEIRMLKEDRVKPGKYIYSLLINGCARAGYMKKAFQLYNKMKQRDLKIKPSIYTSLFNACANSPYPKEALEKANRLREIMEEKNYSPNIKNYNAMIKAYGRCGDIKTSYQIADEMLEKSLPVSTETFNFLLQSCASDKDYGFRHALLTWHKMLRRNCTPDIYTFSTMLRCVRDCSIGDLETMEEVLIQILSKNSQKLNEINADKIQSISSGSQVQEKSKNNDNYSTPLLINEANTSESIETKINNKEFMNDSNNLNLPSSENISQYETPNLLCSTPHLGSLISISEIKNPEDRLLLLGGFSGLLEEMKKAKITPDIEFFTLLLEVIPSTIAAEKKLISMIRKIGLKADIDFFNMLIKKRCMRFDYDGAKDVLNMIKTAKLYPDIITYGVLSLSCKTQDDARELLSEMQNKGIRMNIQILGAMLRQGCAQRNFNYINEILQITLDERIKPNEEFLKHLDKFHKGCLKMIQQKHPITKKNIFKNNFKNFENKLDVWNEEWDIKDLKIEDAIKKIKEKPYKQFKERQIDGIEDNKNEKLLKKHKIRKYIKKIKIKDDSDDGINEDKLQKSNQRQTESLY